MKKIYYNILIIGLVLLYLMTVITFAINVYNTESKEVEVKCYDRHNNPIKDIVCYENPKIKSIQYLVFVIFGGGFILVSLIIYTYHLRFMEELTKEYEEKKKW